MAGAILRSHGSHTIATDPGGGWVRVSTETLDALSARKAAQGDHSFDPTVRGLLE